MKWLDYRRIPVKSIHCDVAEIERRTKAEHVLELASDIRARGDEPIQAPTIRSTDNGLICGRDRLAALIILKVTEAWVHVVECDDNEAKGLELAENIYRRAENRAELLAELVRLKEQHLKAQNEAIDANGNGNSVADRVGAPKLSAKAIKVRARREVARAAGVKPVAVKRAEQRASAKAKGRQPAPDRPLLPSGFNDLGVGVDNVRANKISQLSEQLGRWDMTQRSILRELGPLKGSRSLGYRHIDRIHAAVQAVRDSIQEASPASLCFRCRGKPTDCDACDNIGWLGRGDAPPEPAPKKKGQISVVVVGQDGSQFLAGDDDAVPGGGGPESGNAAHQP